MYCNFVCLFLADKRLHLDWTWSHFKPDLKLPIINKKACKLGTYSIIHLPAHAKSFQNFVFAVITRNFPILRSQTEH